MPTWRGTTRSAASAHTMHTVHYLRIRRVTGPRFRARGGRLKRSGARPTASGRTTRDADHGCAQWAIMTASHPDDAFERWRNALLDALATPGNVMAWQDRRYQFAYQVG
jgi:hypothetical protein